MSIEIDRETLPCGVCGARVTELRRGRCWGCYMRWQDTRPVGKNAACTICHERRRAELRLVEFHNRSYPLCHSCAGRLARLERIPRSLTDVRRVFSRERRELERRNSAIDARIFPRERRVGERRAPPRGTHDTDPRMTLPDLGDIVIELEEADIESVEQTLVRERRSP